MFWIFPYDENHVVTSLQKELEFFFVNLQKVDQNTVFNKEELFSTEFSAKLSHQNQESLLDKFKTFFDEYQKMADATLRQELIECFNETNDIEKLLADVSLPTSKLKLSQFPEKLTNAVKNLFIYMYETTMKSSRRRHYKDIYPKIPRYCPFCGLEEFVDSDRFTQDYDHILNKANYPFAAVNLRNLVPTGKECNQLYKHQIDVINSSNGDRRVFNNPYRQSFEVKVTLDGSVLPSASQSGSWQINLIADDPSAASYIQTWNEVFSIKDRYAKFIAKDNYHDWLKDFILVEKEKGNIDNVNQLKARFSAKANQFSYNIYNDKKFLRFALFSFWANCDDNKFYESILRELRA